MDPILQHLEEIAEHLRSRAFLYDDPACFTQGIEAAVIAVREQLEALNAVA